MTSFHLEIQAINTLKKMLTDRGYILEEDSKEDFTIRKTDSIIVAATADNDHSNLEVYIYEHEKSNLFVHHEIILGAYPLCLEWLCEWQG